MVSPDELQKDFFIDDGPINTEDLLNLRAILVQHIRNGDSGNPIQDEIDQIVFYAQGLRDEHGSGRKFILARLKENNELVGCVSYAMASEQLSRHFCLSQEESVELYNAFISSAMQHKGVGHSLLKSVCERASLENKRCLVVQSGPRYKGSWGFYDKTFDASGGYLANAYGEGIDAKVWIKFLEPTLPMSLPRQSGV